MILGVYWYFKFPEILYRFSYFKFQKGLGGHADYPAELEARISVSNSENLIKSIEELHFHFKHAYVDIKINENNLMISTGDYTLFDHHFQLVSEIEKLLVLNSAVSFNGPFEIKSSRTLISERKNFENIEHRFIQVTGSDFKKDNAENLSVRIDCNLPMLHKKPLINDLIKICHEENIRVFYYYEHQFKESCNLMLFFSNGRQMNNAVQNVDINSFGSKVRSLAQQYPLQFGHFGGMEYYPKNGPYTELMTDEEYILDKK
ncbi:hypothetical protein [Chryseobacterium vrystaatense]|uniref:Uncharacterized protein n=1 Tax=Chryseobacterium vrystaatense TaxID=307480 RepID=A0ABR4UKF9_9FLAO|nr:hypothetical protein [Chryseobacterium vrystaatense]KFF25324.1 hypothetical protein IW16_15040 [Chryseobacterium vrystaatense]